MQGGSRLQAAGTRKGNGDGAAHARKLVEAATTESVGEGDGRNCQRFRAPGMPMSTNDFVRFVQ